MRMATHREHREEAERGRSPSRLQLTAGLEAAEHLEYLHIHQVWSVQGCWLGKEAGLDALTEGRSEQQFDDSRGVDDDHRASRSARTASAPVSVVATASRRASASRSSSGVICSPTRSNSRRR